MVGLGWGYYMERVGRIEAIALEFGGLEKVLGKPALIKKVVQGYNAKYSQDKFPDERKKGPTNYQETKKGIKERKEYHEKMLYGKKE